MRGEVTIDEAVTIKGGHMTLKKSTKVKAKKAAAKTAKKVTKKVGEVYRVEGKKLLVRVKELIKEGNVRRITVKSKTGKVIFVLPVTAGVLGAVLLPPLAVLAAVLVFAGEYQVEVTRKG
jgi:hypothetical protein